MLQTVSASAQTALMFFSAKLITRMNDLLDLQRLAVATAIGFLIGFEREWRHKEDDKARNFAGARTFALTSFAGALAAQLGEGLLLLAVGLAATAALAVAAYWAEAREKPGAGGTTEVALIGAYLLGALAVRGDMALAAAAGVGAAIILASKPRVTGLAAAISQREIGAALRFLAISVIVLPILPDKGYGPFEALNPRAIWWMVVLISGLSFIGYWLTKLRGSGGVLMTGMLGAIASSTAATLSLARLVRDGVAAPSAGAAGIVAANAVMLIRVGVLLAVTSLPVLYAIWPSLAASLAASALAAFFYCRGDKRDADVQVEVKNPMELKPALIFAALLALITLASRYALDQFGSQGLFAVAGISGFADVDAITLTAGRQAAAAAVDPKTAGTAILIAVAVNTAVKGAMAFGIARREAGVRVGGAFAAAIAAGAAALFLI
jgi:uncharacterized membrane protein (DUF4010 family)